MKRYSHRCDEISEFAHLAADELFETLRGVMSSPLPTAQSREQTRVRAGRETIMSPRALNQLIRERLVALGWQQEFNVGHGKMAVDFYKSGVIAEIQLGKDVYCAENLHCKFPIAFERRPLEVKAAILVVPTISMKRHMSNGIGSFEMVLRNYVEPDALQSRLGYPLQIFGIE